MDQFMSASLFPHPPVYDMVSGLFLLFFWCPCMAINLQYNGGLFPDIILLTHCYLLFPSGNPFKRYLAGVVIHLG